MAKVLLVEDEADLSLPIKDWLDRESHNVEVVADGLEASGCLSMHKYDLIILDILLPKMNGLDICREFRAHGGTTPILMLTAKSAVEDKETGLDAGADDYLTKPFHLKELSARVRALLRRPQPVVGDVYVVGNLTINTKNRNVSRNGTQIKLVPREYSLLEFLVRHANQVFSAEALLERVWESESEVLPDTVRTTIKTLRKKLDEPGKSSVIQTIYGVGYRVELA